MFVREKRSEILADADVINQELSEYIEGYERAKSAYELLHSSYMAGFRDHEDVINAEKPLLSFVKEAVNKFSSFLSVCVVTDFAGVKNEVHVSYIKYHILYSRLLNLQSLRLWYAPTDSHYSKLRRDAQYVFEVVEYLRDLFCVGVKLDYDFSLLQELDFSQQLLSTYMDRLRHDKDKDRIRACWPVYESVAQTSREPCGNAIRLFDKASHSGITDEDVQAKIRPQKK